MASKEDEELARALQEQEDTQFAHLFQVNIPHARSDFNDFDAMLALEFQEREDQQLAQQFNSVTMSNIISL